MNKEKFLIDHIFLLTKSKAEIGLFHLLIFEVT